MAVDAPPRDAPVRVITPGHLGARPTRGIPLCRERENTSYRSFDLSEFHFSSELINHLATLGLAEKKRRFRTLSKYILWYCEKPPLLLG